MEGNQESICRESSRNSTHARRKGNLSFLRENHALLDREDNADDEKEKCLGWEMLWLIVMGKDVLDS